MNAVATVTPGAVEAKRSFRWIMQTGESIQVHKMKTSHVFNSLRMIYNNTCPRGMETRLVFKRYVLNRPASYWKQAVKSLVKELVTRKDLTPSQLSELSVMSLNLRLYYSKFIPE